MRDYHLIKFGFVLCSMVPHMFGTENVKYAFNEEVLLDVIDTESIEDDQEPDDPRHSTTDEQRLLRALISNYDPAVRPVYDARHSVVIKLGITLTQIIDMDEKNQVLTTNIWLDQNKEQQRHPQALFVPYLKVIFYTVSLQEWRDEKLEWNLSDYNNISVLRVPCDFIWLPDIVLYNSVDNHNKGYMKSLAMVHSDGNVFWPPIVRMRSSCKMDITYFPFDDQLCGLILGSWAYDGLQVDVTNRSGNVDLSNYVDSGEWQLLDTKIIRREKYYTCCPEPYVDVTFYIMIRRRVLYYFLNVIIPCMLLSSLSLTGFLLPPDAGEKVTLGLTVLLAFSVFMLLVAENMPPTSEYVPLIGIYLTVIMAMSAMSVALSVFVLNCHHRGTRLYRPPNIVRGFAKIAAKCFCMRLTYLSPRTDTSNTSNVTTKKPRSKHNSSTNMLRTQASGNQHCQNMASDSSRDSHLASSTSSSFQPNPSQCLPNVDSTSPNGAAGSNHATDNTSRKRDRGRTRSMVELQMLQYLQEVLEAYTKEREDRLHVLEWQEVARVLDKFFFWIFVVVTTAITIFLLMLSPIAKKIEFPTK